MVTGASGFVGGTLVNRLLREKWDVTALEHDRLSTRLPPQLDVVRGRLESLEDCERAVVRAEPDVVFHLGAQAIVPIAVTDPWATFETNVRGTYNIMEACRRHTPSVTSIVVASSDKAYGELGERPYRENDPLLAEGPYDVSKACADMVARSYGGRYAMKVAVVRAGNIYGPGDNHRTRLIPSICMDLAAGRRPVITSDGTPIRDYVYVDDVVTGYLMAAERTVMSFPTVVNLAGGQPRSVTEVVELIGRLATDKAYGYVPHDQDVRPVYKTDRTWEIKRQVLDTTLARSWGWTPKHDLATGLGFTLDYWFGTTQL